MMYRYYQLYMHYQIGDEIIMLYLRQFCIILFVSFLGELLHVMIPLPIPASVYGLILMLSALCTRIIKINQVKEAAGFLIEIMPVMFIPAAVGLLKSWSFLKPVWIPVIFITLISTIIVMAVTGQVTQKMIQIDKTIGEKNERISG
jgi:Putative effector of murein hydrolase LrgA